MKIGLIDVDGKDFPNLALMKLSTYHKEQGDSVEWYSGIDHYDRVYMSKVFTFTHDDNRVIQADEVIKGGTGYGMFDDLFCDDVEPDYKHYPINKKYDGKTSYGYLTRGCIRKCPWCIVPKKEGYIRPYRDIETVLGSNKRAILMDNNILACDYGLEQIEQIIKLGCRVDFNQGLDVRLVTNEVARMLAKVKWLESIRFSCDTTQALEPVISCIEKLNSLGVDSKRISLYTLVQDVDEALDRIYKLRELGVKAFAQPYRDYENKVIPTQEQKLLANWVNQPKLFLKIDFEEFKKRREDRSNRNEEVIKHLSLF